MEQHQHQSSMLPQVHRDPHLIRQQQHHSRQFASPNNQAMNFQCNPPYPRPPPPVHVQHHQPPQQQPSQQQFTMQGIHNSQMYQQHMIPRQPMHHHPSSQSQSPARGGNRFPMQPQQIYPQSPVQHSYPQPAFYSPQQQQQQQQMQQHVSRGHLSPQSATPLVSPMASNRLDVSTSPLNGSSPTSSMDNRKSRRRTGSSKSGTLQIRRPPEAPITIQGWLYKQGAEGLMLWKKRWFVLSEFVLYYHKSPEDAPSGSIPLPSYKISPASKDDGISKKFAFKAEHKNMRTYFFAAETKDAMIQWMNAMSLASIGEQEKDFSQSQHKLASSPSALNHVHNHPPVVHQMFSPNGNAYQYHPPTKSPGTNSSGGIQPLYANAPPKPRRMNTSRDQSPSPERNGGGLPEANQFVQHDPMMVTGRYHHPLSDVHQAHIIVDDIPANYRMRPQQVHHERRTPEAYGRMSQMRMMNQNYEDIYNHQMLQQHQHHQLAMHQSAVQLAQMRTGMNKHGSAVARPHSADFLEYDPMVGHVHHPQTPNPGNRGHGRHNRTPQQPPRPKSSIEQRMLMDKQTFEESQIRSQSRASGIYDHRGFNNHNTEQARVKYYPPIPSPHDSQLDLASEEVSRYFPTPSPRKSLPSQAPPPPQHPPPQDYQNVVMPNRRQSTGDYFQGKRAESVTPMVAAASGLIDGEQLGEFKRSSSARLHRNKRNHPEFFNLDENKRREQREESMKRLLEWKQRMLQSPLTRKSSRNASRTQTPTNSDSPIPGAFLQHDPSPTRPVKSESAAAVKLMNNGKPQPSSLQNLDKRVARKGSSASRTSRSRSSPRISNRPGVAGMSSSDEDTPETRQSRKRSKSQQSRGSRGSRSNSMSKLNSEQPEYINISSLDETSMTQNQSDLSVVNHPSSAELMIQKAEWNRRAIGPDAWYNDDFNFDKAQHSFANDPLLKQQYGQLLDMRYNGAYQREPEQELVICHDSEMEHKPVLTSNRRSNTWHGDKFAAELQIFEKKNSTSGILHVKQSTESQGQVAPNRQPSNKEHWTPTKVIDEIRKVKEAPPKNVVQDRRRRFEGKSDEAEESFTLSDINSALEEAQKEAEDRQKKHSRIVSDFALSDSKESTSDGQLSKDDSEASDHPTTSTQRKRSVMELLNDFEKKSQALQEEEKKSMTKMGSASTGTRRRVFSDTETMMYDTSSDENDSAFDPPAPNAVQNHPKLDASLVARKSSLPTLLPSNKLSEASPSSSEYLPMSTPLKTTVLEDQYLKMTPPTERKPSSIVSVSSLASSNNQESENARRPSQSVVLEHLINEFGPERAKAIMESFGKEEEASAASAKVPVESPNYQEIDTSKPANESQGHYEYLFKATSNDDQKNYEVVYQEIPDDHPVVKKQNNTRSPSEMLPDILGNAPAGRGNSSSDADDEAIKDPHSRSLFEASDTFTPASFYLDKGRKTSESTSNREPLGSINSLSSRELPQTPIEEHQQQQRPSSQKFQGNTFLKQDINLTYQSVYENDDIGFTSSSSTDQLAAPPPASGGHQQPVNSKVPYYVADIKRSSEEHIPVMTSKRRRAQTPDSFLLEQQGNQVERSQVQKPAFNQDGVVRSKSLEGLLGDGPAGPRDSVQVNMMQHHPVPASPTTSSFRSTPLPARGHDPPPIPEGVPPLDLSSYWQQVRLPSTMNDGATDDETWRESLRRASARVKQSPEHTLPPRLVPPGSAMVEQPNMSPYINGYIWDQREQRFYRLNADPTSPPNPRLFRQPFLDQGLPIHTTTNEADDNELARIKQLMQQRPMSVGPLLKPSNGINSMMGRPSSTLPTSSTIQSVQHQHSIEHQSTSIDNSVAERDAAWQKRRLSFTQKREQRIKRNVAEITAQDLLGKSHEELVLLLIHLRRQAVALSEAVDASMAEVENLANAVAGNGSETESGIEAKAMLEDAEEHLKEMQEKLKRVQPMINLIDNMVKLGSLYKNAPPADSHLLNLQPKVKNELQRINSRVKIESELRKVTQQIQMNERLLEDLASEFSRWEQEVKAVKSHAVYSANQDWERGLSHPSANTLQIDADLNQAQQNVQTIQKRMEDVNATMQNLVGKKDFLANQIIRPSPNGVAGAEPVPSKRRSTSTWYETDIDSGICIDRSAETEAQIKAEIKAKQAGSNYINAFDEEIHNYENTFDPDLDEVQTVHSEGVRSEAPPLPAKPAELQDYEMYSLGDISEADERVKKFYGLIPKNQQMTEIKTVRMVKRDSKERSVSRNQEPIPPRGNYQNVHDFLNGWNQAGQQGYQGQDESVNYNLKANTLPKATDKENLIQVRSTISLAQYYHNKGKEEKSGNVAMSAYERLFGSSRETSLSPPESPSKRMIRGSSGESSLSPIMSPVFKSDAAKAIVEEVGVVSGQKRVHRRIKKRSLTVTGSHPAVLEALQAHNAKQSARSRDDLDMEQALGPRGLSTPDVIKSALDHKNESPAASKLNAKTIDNLFGIPDKIQIPERYNLDQEEPTEEVTPEEKQVRLKKADSIRKMLAEQSTTSQQSSENMDEEKKAREQLLALNQVIAQQVLQKRRSLPGSK